jgi:hypothetical protein
MHYMPKENSMPESNQKRIRRPALVWEETQEIIQKIKKKLDGRVLYFFTSTDSRIHNDDVKYFYSHLKKIGHQKCLYFIIVSHGGNGESAWRIACLLKNYCEELIVVLPEAAASAATILSLAADEIIMTPLAYLTPVDTSIFHPLNPQDVNKQPIYVELDEVRRAVQLILDETKKNVDPHEVYKTIFQYIHPVALGAIARSTNLSEMLCNDIMDLQRQAPNIEFKKQLIKKLNSKYPSHSYPIPRHKARDLGLRIRYSDAELDDLLGSLLNISVHLTKPVNTYLGRNEIHIESISTIIESTDLRFYLTHSFQKRLDVILKNWLTIKDEYHWMRVARINSGAHQLRTKQTKIDY